MKSPIIHSWLILVSSFIFFSGHLVSAQYMYHGVDLGFRAPGEINFQLDRYVEELSYEPVLLNSTYFNNWKRSPAPLEISDIMRLWTVSGDISRLQLPDINFFQAVRLEVQNKYNLLLQSKSDTRLYEFQCELHDKFKEIDCSTFKYYMRKEGAIAFSKTSSFNVLLRQDQSKGKDFIEISRGPLDNLYTIIEADQGSLNSRKISFREFNGVSYLLVLKKDQVTIDVYQLPNSLDVSPENYQNNLRPTVTIHASKLGVIWIDEIYGDEFIPNLSILRSGKAFHIFNTDNLTSTWSRLAQFTPEFNQPSPTEDQRLSVYVSFPKVVLINPKSKQILEYDISKFSNITLRREYMTFGCDFTRDPSEGARSEFTSGQNLLYVFCQPSQTTTSSYIFVYDVERNYREFSLDYNYQLFNSYANLRKAIQFDSIPRSSFTFAVASVDSVSDLVFYIQNGKINAYKLFRHYQVTGNITKDQYCSSVEEFDCFYHAFISMTSNLNLTKQDETKFVEELYIDVTFTQVPPKVNKGVTHSTLSNHATQLNTFEIFDGSIFNFTIKQSEGVDLTIKKPLELFKEIAFQLPSNEAVLDFSSNGLDKIFMTAGNRLYLFDVNLHGGTVTLQREYFVGPNCRHVYAVLKTENFVLACSIDDQLYNVSSYRLGEMTSELLLQWRKVVNSHSFKGKMSPDGKAFFILYDISDTNYHFIEQYSLEPSSAAPVYFVPFQSTDFYRKIYNTPLANNTFIQAFDVTINRDGDSYLVFAITNDHRVVICRTSITNGSNATCRSQIASIFEPRPEQRPEPIIYNELKILNDTHFLVNTLNSYTYYFSTFSWFQDKGDLGFLSSDAEMGLAFFSDYPKYPHITLDRFNNSLIITSNGTSEDPLDCVIFLYSNDKAWTDNGRGYVEPPLTVLSRSCPLPTYSPKMLPFYNYLLLIDSKKFSFYSTQASYSLELNHSGMFEPSHIELSITAANQYHSINTTWFVYGNLLYRPINYVIWIADAAVWLLVILFFLKRSSGVCRQLQSSLRKYSKKVARKASDLAWEMSLPMFTTFFIYFFGNINIFHLLLRRNHVTRPFHERKLEEWVFCLLFGTVFQWLPKILDFNHGSRKAAKAQRIFKGRFLFLLDWFERFFSGLRHEDEYLYFKFPYHGAYKRDYSNAFIGNLDANLMK